MRPIIEKFVAALLNEERETASDILRQYIIARAQSINESFRHEEDSILSEDVDDDIQAERYFTDEELSDEDTSEEAAASDDAEFAGDDLGSEEAADSLSDEMGAEEVDGEEEVSAEDGEGTIEDRVDDMEAQLDELTAEFERMMSELDGEASDEDADSEVMGAEEEVTADVEGSEEEKEMVEGDLSVEISHDDDFDDISEAIIDDLEKIKTPNTDGRESGNKSITQNKASLPTVRDKVDGHPIRSKNVTHKGFDRETAPSSARLPKGINTQDGSKDRLKPVSKEGDASAELNKPVKQNNVSPVAKKPKK